MLQVVYTSTSVIDCCLQSIFMWLVVKVWRHVWRGSGDDENDAGRCLKKRTWGNGSVYYSSVKIKYCNFVGKYESQVTWYYLGELPRAQVVGFGRRSLNSNSRTRNSVFMQPEHFCHNLSRKYGKFETRKAIRVISKPSTRLNSWTRPRACNHFFSRALREFSSIEFASVCLWVFPPFREFS